MSKKANNRYSKEFRVEAVKIVIEGDISPYEASSQLSLPKTTLENWVRAFKAGKLNDIGSQQRPLTAVEEELARVKRELAYVKQERDIFFKAVHKRNRETYGPERLQWDLADHGVKVSVHRLKRIRRKFGFAASKKESSRYHELKSQSPGG